MRIFLIILFPVVLMGQDTTRLTNPLYPMSYCVSGNPTQHAAMISDAGGAGEFYTGNTAGIPNIVQAMNDKGLGVMSVYKPLNASDWNDIINHLSGTGAQLAVYASKNAYPNDQSVIDDLKTLGNQAKAEGLKVCIYPHAGFFIESTAKAVDIAEKVNMENVGINFNLPHALRYHNNNNLDFDSSMNANLEKAMPYIFGMSINGADADGKNWIQVLGQGNFDTFGLVKKFLDLGFTGPIALQCYGVSGDKQTNLDAAMTEWNSWKSQLPAQVKINPPNNREIDFYYTEKNLNLNLSGSNTPHHFDLRNTLGQIVISRIFHGKILIPLSLPTGIYHAKLSGENITPIFKKITVLD